jgi:malate dehydrogenase (oxaloacetate-decarboxylating)
VVLNLAHSLVAMVRCERRPLKACLLDLEALGVSVGEIRRPVGDTHWVFVGSVDEGGLLRAEGVLRARFGSQLVLLDGADRVLALHVGGNLRVDSRVAIDSPEALAVVDAPGAEWVSSYLAEHPEAVRDLTGKGTTVAIVSDGSAVGGLGDVGPEAALPVLEGKAVLFRRLADLNGVPLCLGTRDPMAIVAAVSAVAAGFGGIHLEGISAPRCFAIERGLRDRLDVPVLDNDQHGTAVVVLAALRNALRVVGKSLPAARVVVAAAGTAGTAVTKQLLAAGVTDVVVCVESGVLHPPLAAQLPPHQAWLATHTNPRRVAGGLAEALAGADALLVFSPPGVLRPEVLATMDPDPIVFALADIEGNPAEAAAVAATSHPTSPNCITNALAFPGLFRGVLDAGVPGFSPGMLVAAADALAGLVGSALGPQRLLPDVLDPDVVPAVAAAVAEQAASSPAPRRRSHQKEHP